jgi:hypothetical protein
MIERAAHQVAAVAAAAFGAVTSTMPIQARRSPSGSTAALPTRAPSRRRTRPNTVPLAQQQPPVVRHLVPLASLDSASAASSRDSSS